MFGLRVMGSRIPTGRIQFLGRRYSHARTGIVCGIRAESGYDVVAAFGSGEGYRWYLC